MNSLGFQDQIDKVNTKTSAPGVTYNGGFYTGTKITRYEEEPRDLHLITDSAFPPYSSKPAPVLFPNRTYDPLVKR